MGPVVRPIVALAILVAPLAAQGQQYRDPAGRFTLAVPQGWELRQQGEGVLLTRGSTTMVLSPFGGVRSPDQVIASLAQQYGGQWQNLQGYNNGTYVLGGLQANYAMFQGINPKGVPAVLRLVGAGSGDQAYALIISSPQQEFGSASRELQGIEQSLVFANAGGGMNGGGNPDNPNGAFPNNGGANNPNGAFPNSGAANPGGAFQPNGQPMTQDAGDGGGFDSARLRDPYFLMLVAILLLFIVSATVTISRAQRLFRELKAWSPEWYQALGEPSYIVLAIAGPKYFRPAAADNFFRERRYAQLGSPEFTAKAEAIRGWQRWMYYSFFGLAGYIIFFTYMRG